VKGKVEGIFVNKRKDAMKTSKSFTTRCLSRGLIAVIAAFGTCHLLAADTTQFDHHDTAFIKEAAQGGQAEVQMGALAAQKAQNPEVKQLAESLQQDHMKSNQELLQIAQKGGVTVPTEPARKEERAENRLQDKTGAEFDRSFVEHVLKDHEKDIQEYQKALANCKDPELKAYIEKTLPALRHHLQMARSAGAAAGVDPSVLTAADRFLAGQGNSNLNQGLGTSPGSQTGRGPLETSPDHK
jgi:putative membrane protein